MMRAAATEANRKTTHRVTLRNRRSNHYTMHDRLCNSPLKRCSSSYLCMYRLVRETASISMGKEPLLFGTTMGPLGSADMELSRLEKSRLDLVLQPLLVGHPPALSLPSADWPATRGLLCCPLSSKHLGTAAPSSAQHFFTAAVITRFSKKPRIRTATVEAAAAEQLVTSQLRYVGGYAAAPQTWDGSHGFAGAY